MPELVVKVDLHSVAAARGAIDADKRKLAKVIERTINDTARHTRTLISKDVREILPLKKRTVDAAIRVRYARARYNRFADVDVLDGRKLSLRNFQPRQTKAGVTVVLDKRAGRSLATAHTKDGARVSTAGAFGPKIQALQKGVFRRVGKKRLPIEKLFGPTVYDTVTAESIDAHASRTAEIYLARRFEQRLRLAFDETPAATSPAK